LLEFSANGVHAPQAGNRHRRFAPQGCYPCSEEDQWVTLTVTSDDQWRRLCEALDKTAWGSEARFADVSGRREHHDEIDRVIEAWTRGRTHREAMRILGEHAIPAGAVLTTADLRADPHLEARDYFVSDPADATKKMMGLPFRTSRGAGAVRWRGPDLGVDNTRIAGNKLGLDPCDAPSFTCDEIGTTYDPE
jgi:crotonobetainyl-CoA:carnitine CoA-transferase CaiB-like acyl-CoA transferase